MGKVLGNANRAYIKPAGQYVWLGGEQDNTVDLTAEAVETSDKTNEWASFISGKKGATVSITCHADTEDSAQEAAISALVEGTIIDWAVGVIDGEVTSGEYGQGVVTGVNFANNVGAVATRSINITATGEVHHV